MTFPSLVWLCLLTAPHPGLSNSCPRVPRTNVYLCACTYIWSESCDHNFCRGNYRFCSLLTLSLFPSPTSIPSGTRNTPESATTYARWEWCQRGCWPRVAGVCFSMVFHTLCTTPWNPGGLVPLWAPLYHLSKSSPHEGKSQLAWELESGQHKEVCSLPSGGFWFSGLLPAYLQRKMFKVTTSWD